MLFLNFTKNTSHTKNVKTFVQQVLWAFISYVRSINMSCVVVHVLIDAKAFELKYIANFKHDFLHKFYFTTRQNVFATSMQLELYLLQRPTWYAISPITFCRIISSSNKYDQSMWSLNSIHMLLLICMILYQIFLTITSMQFLVTIMKITMTTLNTKGSFCLLATISICETRSVLRIHTLNIE